MTVTHYLDCGCALTTEGRTWCPTCLDDGPKLVERCAEGVEGCPCRVSHKHAKGERPDVAPPKEVMQNEPPERDTSISGADVNGAPTEEPPYEVFCTFMDLEAADQEVVMRQLATIDRVLRHLRRVEEETASDAVPVAWLAEDHRFTPVRRSLHFEESTGRAHHGTHEADSDEPIPLYAHPEDAPGGPYQMDAVDDIPPELKDRIALAVSEEHTRQMARPVVDYFKLWRAGLGPCREKLNQLANGENDV